MARRRTILTAGIGLVAAGLSTSACGGDTAHWREAGTLDNGDPSPTPAVKVTITPAAQTADVSPAETIMVAADGGRLQSVTITGGTKEVAGGMEGDQRGWRSSGTLEYGATYTVTVSAVDDAGMTVEQTSTFTTVTPTSTVKVTFQANPFLVLKTGGTYGVGQPVCVCFNRKVTDRDAAVKALTVTAQPAVEGRWHWIDSQNVHWRPQEYWTPGTTISVKADLLGVKLGDGVYGAANSSTNFTIGQSRIAKADANTHHMLIYVDGKMVRDIPVSLGKKGTAKTSDGRTINYETTRGVHVLLNKEPTVQMSSGSYGVTNESDPNYYDEEVKLCCRITRSGEFVHLADWQSSMQAQGRSNVSHGCINVGPAHAQWFYDNFQIGDIVEVTNTSNAMAIDNGLGDWNVAWGDW